MDNCRVKGQPVPSSLIHEMVDSASLLDSPTALRARLAEDGYLYLVDRTSDMIVSGGYNVYPREVEDALAAHPAVREVVVVGLPDDKWGESVCAFVALRAGVQADEVELIAFARDKVASYKVPKQVRFIDEVPKSPVGKLLRRAVRDPFWQGRERKI